MELEWPQVNCEVGLANEVFVSIICGERRKYLTDYMVQCQIGEVGLTNKVFMRVWYDEGLAGIIGLNSNKKEILDWMQADGT